MDVAGDAREALLLKAMIAVAAADGAVSPVEAEVIQQIYEQYVGHSIPIEEVSAAAETRASLLAELAAAAPGLDRARKEEILCVAYLALLADDRIAGEERKKLHDIAAALKVPEIHFGAILEGLAITLPAGRQAR